MNWDYFIADGKFKVRKLPRPKQTVKIEDITEIYSDFRTELKSYGEDIEGAKKSYLDHYSDIFMVEVEVFYEYFDRNPKKFLQDLNGLKGKYGFIEGLFYWGDSDYWGMDRNIEMWDRLYEPNQDYSPNGKTLEKLEKLGLIERKVSSEKSDLISYIESGATVNELKGIGTENSVSLSGKKAEIIGQLVASVKEGLIKHTTIDMYRPGKNFQTWFDSLQIKYVDEIEFALLTFDYPEFYIREVWREAALVNDEFPLVESTIKKRHQEYFKVTPEIELKDLVGETTETFNVAGLDINITTNITIDDEKSQEKALPSKKDINHLIKKRRKKEEKKLVVDNNRFSFTLITIVMILLLLAFFKP